MALCKCKQCGLPLRLSQGYIWPGNGVILARQDPSTRMVIFESDYNVYVWNELEERLGVSISDTMIRGQKASNQDYLDNHILYGWRKYALQHIPLRFMFERIANDLSLFGFGSLELLAYRKKKTLVMKVKHPFDVISIAWGAKGVFELAENMGSEVAWITEGEETIFTIQFVPGKKYTKETDLEAMRLLRDAKRELSLAGRLLPPQGDRGEPCPSCGLPAALTELEWREDEGTIRRSDSGRRYIFTSGHIFLAIIRDLERSSGRDVESIITQITRGYHLRGLKGINIHSRKGAYRAAARYLFAGGFGEVKRFNCGEGYLEMTIVNPFYIPRLVGRIAGLFEYVEDQEADIDYRLPDANVLELEIRAT